MSGVIPFLAKQATRQAMKKAITHSIGLDDFLGVKPLNEYEDIVINELQKIDSPARKSVFLWTEQDYHNAINSSGFSQNYMLQDMCEEYLKLHDVTHHFE